MDNPFSTKFVRPGALAWIGDDESDPDKLIQRLESFDWKGQICGPHGCGKSTLLESLKPRIRNRLQVPIFHVTFRSQDPDTQDSIGRLFSAKDCFLVIDGLEQLKPATRKKIVTYSSHSNAGLLVTTHQPMELPVLIHLKPDRALFHQIVDRLLSDAPLQLDSNIVKRAFENHVAANGSVREALFELYDHYERKRRQDGAS